MTPRTELIIKSLLVARKKIVQRSRRFICPALPRNDVKKILITWIYSQLGIPISIDELATSDEWMLATYDDWIRINHPDIFDGDDQRWRVEGRLQWIDAMISELKKGS